jgi:hypothetical protein
MALSEIKMRDDQCRDLEKRMRESLDSLDKSDRRRQELDILNEQVLHCSTLSLYHSAPPSYTITIYHIPYLRMSFMSYVGNGDIGG